MHKENAAQWYMHFPFRFISSFGLNGWLRFFFYSSQLFLMRAVGGKYTTQIQSRIMPSYCRQSWVGGSCQARFKIAAPAPDRWSAPTKRTNSRWSAQAGELRWMSQPEQVNPPSEKRLPAVPLARSVWVRMKNPNRDLRGRDPPVITFIPNTTCEIH